MTGFIGHHLAEYFLKNTDWQLVGLERYGHSGTPQRINHILRSTAFRKRVRLVWHDLRSPFNEFVTGDIGDVDLIFHLAASTHVDRAIADPMAFVYDNVVGTCNLLQFARTHERLHRFFYFSTDEVFGPAPSGVSYREWDRYRSSNPYAATKAGAEELALAFENTYKLPVVVTHTMNVFGERQHPEKFIPKAIRACMEDELLLIHSNRSRTVSGSRFYIHASNVAAALIFLVDHGVAGEKYNIVGEREVSNLQLAELIADSVKKRLPHANLAYELVDFHSSRPGHDLRYALDGAKLREMGFSFSSCLEDDLDQVVDWSIRNPKWLGCRPIQAESESVKLESQLELVG
jgi:dTDP-glucose 4,6-dehydratase